MHGQTVGLINKMTMKKDHMWYITEYSLFLRNLRFTNAPFVGIYEGHDTMYGDYFWRRIDHEKNS